MFGWASRLADIRGSRPKCSDLLTGSTERCDAIKRAWENEFGSSVDPDRELGAWLIALALPAFAEHDESVREQVSKSATIARQIRPFLELRNRVVHQLAPVGEAQLREAAEKSKLNWNPDLLAGLLDQLVHFLIGDEAGLGISIEEIEGWLDELHDPAGTPL